jgi:hypothetical protein
MLATVSVLGCVLLSGCSDGQDGDPGPKGPDGPDGPAGNSGKDGDGFQESISYGNIVVSFTGKRANGEDFADTVNFRFAPLGVNGFKFGSFANTNTGDFFIHRFYSAVDPTPDLQDNFVRFELVVIPTADGMLVLPQQCIISTYMQASDTSLITIQRDFSGILASEDFKDFHYNPTTGDLSFRLSFAEHQQQTGVGISELKVTVAVNVKVFQQIRKP